MDSHLANMKLLASQVQCFPTRVFPFQEDRAKWSAKDSDRCLSLRNAVANLRYCRNAWFLMKEKFKQDVILGKQGEERDKLERVCMWAR